MLIFVDNKGVVYMYREMVFNTLYSCCIDGFFTSVSAHVHPSIVTDVLSLLIRL